MHPHGERGRRRVVLGVALGVATALVAPVLGGVPAASADAIAAKRKDAARLAARIDAQGERLSTLDENYNQTRLRLAKLREQLSAAQADERQAASRLVQVQARLQRRAIVSYVDPRRTSALGALSSGDLDADVTRAVYLGTVTGDERNVLDALRAARDDLGRLRATVSGTRDAVASAAKRLERQRGDAEALLSGQQRLLAGVKGDLGRLLVEEQARRAAAEARLAKDALARRQAAARAELARRGGAKTGAGVTGSGSARTSRDLAILAGLAPEPPASPSASRAAAVARTLLGLPYRWGAAGPGSFDCSGLVLYAYRAAGRSLPHSSRAQYSATTRVPVADVRVGDLLFYGSPIHHVGIYVGGGTMVAAPRTGYSVKVSSIYRRDLVGVGRVG